MEHPANAPRSRRRRTAWLAIGAAAIAIVAACSALTPRQGWRPELGPVVPHDTFPAQCDLCHLGPSWNVLREDFAFDHEKETGTALRGAHERTQCLFCHNDRGPVQQFAALGCAGCHQDPHRGELGRHCTGCHDERTWRPGGMIALHDRTRFPLAGAHAAVACFRCHPGAQVGNFKGASAECAHCHAADVARATAFDHAANGALRDCQRCHRQVAWSPAQFAHPASMPLTGGHALACAACHTTPGTFTGLSPVCASCHTDTWQATTNPPHAAMGLGTDCQSCHGTNGWRPSRFVHDPPTTGPHAVSCVECHRTQTVAQYSCTHCHDHSQGEMADKHREVSGYSWVSSECFRCHPRLRD